jgi:hypothetical protein
VQRVEKEEPKTTLLKTEIYAPPMKEEKRDILLPTLTFERQEKLDPVCKKLRILARSPNLALFLRLRLDAKRAYSRTEHCKLIFKDALSDIELPITQLSNMLNLPDI